MSTLTSLRGELRPMTERDLDLVLEWRNHIDIRRYMYTQHEISIEEHRCWFERATHMPDRHLLIYEAAGVPLGFLHFSRISEGMPVADWGFYMAPEVQKGTGRNLGEIGLSYAFESLKLHKVCGQALDFNERSIAFHKRLGFSQEGILRDQHFDGHHYHSVFCFGLLAREWNRENKES